MYRSGIDLITNSHSSNNLFLIFYERAGYPKTGMNILEQPGRKKIKKGLMDKGRSNECESTKMIPAIIFRIIHFFLRADPFT